MSEEGGDETAGTCRPSPAEAAPLDSANLLGEILLRLPAQPSSLPRVSAVSKLWESLVTSAAFHRRFRAHHRQPPILGVYGKTSGDILFTSVLDPPDRVPAERFAFPVSPDDFFDSWSLLGCRHGRVLAFNQRRLELLVFHPVSGDRRAVALPPGFAVVAGYGHGFSTSGAVLCAAGHDDDNPGHAHGGCQSSPFKLVLVGTFHGNQRPAIARVYSSETGLWGNLVSTRGPCGGFFGDHPGTLIGNGVYCWLHGFDTDILEFNLDSQRLAVIKRLPVAGADIRRRNMRIIRAEDGGDVGIVILTYPSLHMWDHKVSRYGSAKWVLRKTVNLQNIIGIPSLTNAPMVAIVAYAEDADEIFVSVRGAGYPYRGSLIAVQLESMKLREYRGSFLEDSYHPFTDFFTAGNIRTRSTPIIEPHQPSSH